MYLRFGNNASNVWEVKAEGDNKMIAIYRGRVTNTPEPIQDIEHNERSYRLWKTFSSANDGSTHMPDVFPLMFYMFSKDYEIVTKIRDSKYTFTRIQ